MPGSLHLTSAAMTISTTKSLGRCERPVGSGLVPLRNDLDQEPGAETADMAGVIFRLKMELVDADALRRRDLDLEIVVLAAVGFSHHDALGRDDLNDRVEMVRAHQGRSLERRLDVLGVGLNTVVLLDSRELRRGHGTADRQSGLEHERIVVGAQHHRLDAGRVDLRREGEQAHSRCR